MQLTSKEAVTIKMTQEEKEKWNLLHIEYYSKQTDFAFKGRKFKEYSWMAELISPSFWEGISPGDSIIPIIKVKPEEVLKLFNIVWENPEVFEAKRLIIEAEKNTSEWLEASMFYDNFMDYLKYKFGTSLALQVVSSTLAKIVKENMLFSGVNDPKFRVFIEADPFVEVAD